MRRVILTCLLLATPAWADSYKLELRGTQHCDGVLGQLLGPRFRAHASVDMPASDFGNDGTMWVGDIGWKGASYTRSGDSFAITGWTEQLGRWFHVSVHGRAKGERVRGVFHFLPWGSTCFAEGKVQ